MPKTLLQYFKDHADLSLQRLLFFAGIAGLSNAFILGVVNAAAAAAASEEQGNNLRLLILFFITLAIYALTQRYIFVAASAEVEKIIDKYRVRMIDLIRQCDLDTIEKIGRPFIFGAITRQPQVVSQTAGPLILAAQSAILIFFTLFYLAWLSMYAFYLTIAITAIGVWQYQRKTNETNRDLHLAAAEEDVLFGSLTDVIEGFKEVRIHSARSRDIARFVRDTSVEVKRLKIKVDVHLSVLFVFAQTTFYLLAAAMVFLLPIFGETYSEELLKTTTVVLFLIGPISSVVSAASNATQANAAVEDMIKLEGMLTEADRTPPDPKDILTDFEEIRLDGIVYEHRDEKGEITFRCGPIDWSFRKGEMVFVSGGNGSGKSTLMKLLTALYHPSSGRLLLDGKPVGADVRDRFQSLFTAVYFDFHLFNRSYGLGDVDAERVDRLLEEVELSGKTQLRDGKFDTLALSTGQRKRLALVVALLEDRPICMFDEWAADQDPQFRRHFYEDILPRLRREGKTIIAVTHDDRYFDHCDRRILMEEGRIVDEQKGLGV